jgi:hypothetical protein
MDYKEIRYEIVDNIYLDKDEWWAVVNTVLKFRVS